LPAEVKIDWL